MIGHYSVFQKIASKDAPFVPQRLKAASMAVLGGTAKAVPYPKSSFETSSSD